MPGRPFQSSLEPYLETIRALRLKRRTWRQVAATLKIEHSLEIDPAAVYKFFKRRVRPTTRQPLGFPTLPTATSGSSAAPATAPPPAPSEAQAAPTAPAEAPASARKEFVFIPKPKRPSIFSDEDLQLNDPLAFDTYGKSVPVDPDTENPFKMRKRKAS